MPPRLVFPEPISKAAYAEHNGFHKPLGENHSEAFKNALQLDQRIAVIIRKSFPPNIHDINLSPFIRWMRMFSPFQHSCGLMKWKWLNSQMLIP